MAADGSIVFSTEIDDKKAQADLKKLEEKIQKIESELSESTGKKSAIEKQLDDAKGAAKQTEQEITRIMDALKSELALNEDIASGKITLSDAEWQQAEDRQGRLIADLKGQQDLLKNQDREIESLGKQYDRVTKKIEDQTAALNSAKDAAGDLTARLAGAKQQTSGTSAAAAEAAKRMDKFSQHAKTLAKRVLVFSLIAAGLRALKNYLWEAIQQNDEAVAAIARLKGALMTLAQPIVEVVIPAFTVLINVITRIVTAVAKLISMLFGTTIQKSAAGAKALNKQKDAIDGVGEAAKEASKYLAGFDELNVMDSQDNSSASGSGGFDTSGGIAPDFTSMIDDSLSAILELFTGAALLALGAILAFSGANIPLGIALMILGAIAIWDSISENWDAIKELLQGSLGKIVGIGGLLLLCIGIALLFSGVGIPIGLGLILAGSTLLGTAVAANWETISEILKNPLEHADELIRLYKLVLGVALCFSGVALPLGLALIRESLNTSVSATPRWDYLKNKLTEAWDDIQNWWNTKVAKYFTEKWWNDLGTGVMDSLLSGFKNRWESLKSWVLDKVSWISNAFRPVLDFFTGTKRGGGGSSTSGSFNSNPRMQHMPALRAVQVPALAQGAVIPANREFLAVLGDQKRGTNIEAPADLIRQIFREESGNSGGDIVIRFTGELAQLARVLTPEITRQQRQNQRSWGGGSL